MLKAIDSWQMDNKTDINLPEPETKYNSAFRALFSYIRPYWATFLLILGCIGIAIAADLFQPYLLKIVIDDHLMVGQTAYGPLLGFAVIYLGLSITSFVFSYLHNNLLQYAGQNIVSQIRKRLFDHLSTQAISFYDRHPLGSLITHISSDTEMLSQFFNQVLLSILRDGLTLIFIIIIMFQLDVTVTLYCLVLLPIIAFIAIAFRSYMRKTYQKARTQLSRLISFIAENLAGMNLIQAFHQEEEQQKQFTERNRAYYKANLREIRTNVLFNRSFDILGNVSVAFLVWVGGKSVLNQELEFGVLYAFITYIRMFFQPITTITQQWNTLQSTTVSINRIWSLFASTPEVVDGSESKLYQADSVKGKIDFNDVDFSYKDGNPVIRQLNLHINPGEMIGIVGTTGAGKSSLISLLCRFYDVQSGSIEIDGTDIRQIPQQQLHRLIGLVQQEPFLYSGTIRDNIRLFDRTIDDEQIDQACKLIGADVLISRMKLGFDTRVSESGSGLSAGERQLISFARIIVFKPKILILDEATANMDSYSEQWIQHALQIVSQDRTTLIIAHRLSTIMQADRILVMEDGEVVEEGTHHALLEQHGYYEQLYLSLKYK